jgi:hypothetical protein
MKKLFKQQLTDFLLYLIHKNNWRLDFACEKQLRELIERSVDNVERISFKDCAKEEMRQFAKTNLAFLLTHMHINALTRGIDCMDTVSLNSALSKYTCLWPFKGIETPAINHHNLPVRHMNNMSQRVAQFS